MKRLILVCSLLLLAAPAFGDSAVFNTRKETNDFWQHCLSLSERSTVQIAGRAKSEQEGFTIFYDKAGPYACLPETPEVCTQKCDAPGPSR